MIRCVIGSSQIVCGELRHLDAVSALSNVAIRILPNRAGIPIGVVCGPFVILDFQPVRKGDEEPSLVFAEQFIGGTYFEGVDDVHRHRDAFEKLWRAALEEPPTRTLLREVAAKYDRER